MFSSGWAQEVYERDMKELASADLVVAILDFEHQTIDPGTAYELGRRHDDGQTDHHFSRRKRYLLI